MDRFTSTNSLVPRYLTVLVYLDKVLYKCILTKCMRMHASKRQSPNSYHGMCDLGRVPGRVHGHAGSLRVPSGCPSWWAHVVAL